MSASGSHDWRSLQLRATIGMVWADSSEPEVDDSILFVCSGNVCRSPMAAGLLAARITPRSPVRVSSAGFLTEGLGPPREVMDLMAQLGVDLGGHRSRLVDEKLIAGSTLVIGMTRQHLIDLAVMAPMAWQRCFTLADLVGRAAQVGKRDLAEPLPRWVERAHGHRRRSELLRLPLSQDVPDPMGKSIREYERVRDTLVRLTTTLADLLLPA